MLQYYHNEKALDVACFMEVERQYPELSLAELKQKSQDPVLRQKARRKLLRRDFEEALTAHLGHKDRAKTHADKYFDSLPDEMLPNIVEWCEGQAISDISYKGMSFNMIMNKHSNPPTSFITALQIFKSWQEVGYPPAKEFLSAYMWRR